MSFTLVYPDEFFTSTAAHHLKKVRLQQFRVYRLAKALLEKAKVTGGGERAIVPFDTQEHSVTTQVTTGYESADLNVQPVLSPGSDTWAFNIRPVVYSWVDDAKNSGRYKLIDQTQIRVENTHKALLRDFEKQALIGNIPTMSDINTLNGTGVAGGFIEATAVGAQSNSVHGVSKLAFAALPGFQNQYYDVAGNASANVLTSLRHVTNRIGELTEDPTMLDGYCSLNGAENYLATVQVNERYGEGGADAVALHVKAGGLVWKQTSNMPTDAQTTGAGADDEWSFLALDHNTLCLQLLKKELGFGMTPWRDIGGGHEAKLSFFRFGGQLTISDWGTHGVIKGADTF